MWVSKRAVSQFSRQNLTESLYFQYGASLLVLLWLIQCFCISLSLLYSQSCLYRFLTLPPSIIRSLMPLSWIQWWCLQLVLEPFQNCVMWVGLPVLSTCLCKSLVFSILQHANSFICFPSFKIAFISLTCFVSFIHLLCPCNFKSHFLVLILMKF